MSKMLNNKGEYFVLLLLLRVPFYYYYDPYNNCKRLRNTLTKRGYNKTDAATQINRAISIPRTELLNKIKTSNTGRLTTYCYV